MAWPISGWAIPHSSLPRFWHVRRTQVVVEFLFQQPGLEHNLDDLDHGMNGYTLLQESVDQRLRHWFFLPQIFVIAEVPALLDSHSRSPSAHGLEDIRDEGLEFGKPVKGLDEVVE